MKILIVNDDGFDAVALPHLIRWARTLGDVTCVVPKREQSGKSQAIDYLHPVEITEIAIAEDIRTSQGGNAINPSEKYYQPEFYKKILFDKII